MADAGMRRTRAGGGMRNFPDEQSPVMLLAAGVREVAGTRWAKRK
jgi:hypothetical protein